MKITIILGTRPEIIKLSPIIRFCTQKKIDNTVIHTGQHYDYEMDKKFFDDLHLPYPAININARENEYRKQFGFTMRGITKALSEKRPDIVLVQGDTNSVFAGAQAANRLGIKVGHVEAGLRSGDLTMKEEMNRIHTDHVSDYLFAPTEFAAACLAEEGIEKEKIFISGNTVVDAVKHNLEIVRKKTALLSRLKLTKNNYIVSTFHRAENSDDKMRLQNIIQGLSEVSRKHKLPLVIPLHPRTKNNLLRFKMKLPKEFIVLKPLGYLDFLQLFSCAKLILTDSGGLQEEASILRVPCVTMRDNTERPETVENGMNILAGADRNKIINSADQMLDKKIDWKDLYGDGTAGEKIINFLANKKI